MESDVFLTPLSNGPSKALPVSWERGQLLWLPVTFNPRHLTRSPFNEGTGLSNGRHASESKQAEKVSSHWRQTGSSRRNNWCNLGYK